MKRLSWFKIPVADRPHNPMLNSGALLLCALQKVNSIIVCFKNINWYKWTYISGIDKKSSWQIQTGILLASRPRSNSLLKLRNLEKLAFTKREGWVESHRINLLERWVEEAVKTKMCLLVVTRVLCSLTKQPTFREAAIGNPS